MQADEIIRLLSLGISLLISIIGFVVALIKVIKAKNSDELKKAICEFVVSAENIELSNEEKRQNVLSATEEFCKKHNTYFDATKVDGIIDTILSIMKNLNTKPTEENATKENTSVSDSDTKTPTGN